MYARQDSDSIKITFFINRSFIYRIQTGCLDWFGKQRMSKSSKKGIVKMLKLNASYSKKVPAEGEYSSQSYHASIEVELPDGLTQSQLQSRIHETFELVKNSVESELHGNTASQQGADTPKSSQNQQVQGSTPASPKQIKYMLDLARNKGVTPAQIAAQYGVSSVENLSKNQCSNIINSWRGAA